MLELEQVNLDQVAIFTARRGGGGGAGGSSYRCFHPKLSEGIHHRRGRRPDKIRAGHLVFTLRVAVRLPASHQYEPDSIPGRVTPRFLQVEIVPDNAASWRVSSGIFRFAPPLNFGTSPLLSHSTLIGSQDLVPTPRQCVMRSCMVVTLTLGALTVYNPRWDVIVVQRGAGVMMDGYKVEEGSSQRPLLTPLPFPRASTMANPNKPASMSVGRVGRVHCCRTKGVSLFSSVVDSGRVRLGESCSVLAYYLSKKRKPRSAVFSIVVVESDVVGMVHATLREHCTPVQILARRGNAAIVARASVALIATALLGRKKEKNYGSTWEEKNCTCYSRFFNTVLIFDNYCVPWMVAIASAICHLRRAHTSTTQSATMIEIHAHTMDLLLPSPLINSYDMRDGICSMVDQQTRPRCQECAGLSTRKCRSRRQGEELFAEVPGAHLDERLDCSTPTTANQVRSSVWPLPDFRKWESCWSMPLVCGLAFIFSGISRFLLPCVPALLHSHLILPSSAFKASLLRVGESLNSTQRIWKYASHTCNFAPNSLREKLKNSCRCYYSCCVGTETPEVTRQSPTTKRLSKSAHLTANSLYLGIFPTSEAWKEGSDKGDTVMRIKRSVATTRQPPNWRVGIVERRNARAEETGDLAHSPTRPLATSSGTIPTFENLRETPAGIEPRISLTLIPHSTERGKREIPEETRRPAASPGTIPTCGNPGSGLPGIEPGSPRCTERGGVVVPHWTRIREDPGSIPGPAILI
ncbi:hypothetical protein PR048_027149 [Dryococelus australis]|uniref:Uncharacterized protein n=1 Tax=Dryococelus australis TaxID=614101 RepID=A0ABQ9GEM6_9NEOP|nr:hypothetical protein PR048_027149 [Dryococelus australis]